ncbi:hypothetical protein [Streptomyces sp. NPDC005181]|uniref:hypothetical protein n=1 Tax=Streptomyces sp. NPDC005181 TaxID=3156869 RepID=UPI0033BE904A
MVGWTQAAQQLVGYAAAYVAGRSAAFLLAAAGDRAKASAFSEQGSALSRWSGFTTLRHCDGRGIDVRLWMQARRPRSRSRPCHTCRAACPSVS